MNIDQMIEYSVKIAEILGIKEIFTFYAVYYLLKENTISTIPFSMLRHTQYDIYEKDFDDNFLKEFQTVKDVIVNKLVEDKMFETEFKHSNPKEAFNEK